MRSCESASPPTISGHSRLRGRPANPPDGSLVDTAADGEAQVPGESVVRDEEVRDLRVPEGRGRHDGAGEEAAGDDAELPGLQVGAADHAARVERLVADDRDGVGRGEVDPD